MGYNIHVENLASRVQRTLPPHAASVGEARRLVRAELREAGREALTDAAELLVSELVTSHHEERTGGRELEQHVDEILR